MLTFLKGYRTLIVNGLALIVALAITLGALPADQAPDPSVLADQAEAVADAAEHLADPTKVTAGVVAVLALVNLVLRLFTTTKVGEA